MRLVSGVVVMTPPSSQAPDPTVTRQGPTSGKRVRCGVHHRWGMVIGRAGAVVAVVAAAVGLGLPPAPAGAARGNRSADFGSDGRITLPMAGVVLQSTSSDSTVAVGLGTDCIFRAVRLRSNGT